MRYSVSHLLKEPVGAFLDYQVHEDVTLESGVMQRVWGHLRLSRFDNGILAKAELETEIEDLCSRCLKELHRTIKAVIDEVFIRPEDVKGEQLLPESGAGEGHLIIGEDHILDLQETLRQSFILNRPMKFLCRTDCKGICSVCGNNRNLSSCRCDPRLSDPRWGPLVELLPKQGE